MPDRRIIIVEARPVRRQRLAALAKAEAGLSLVASCANLMEAYTAIEAEVPDLVLIARRLTEAPEHSMLEGLLGLLDIAEYPFSDELAENAVVGLALQPVNPGQGASPSAKAHKDRIVGSPRLGKGQIRHGIGRTGLGDGRGGFKSEGSGFADWTVPNETSVGRATGEALPIAATSSLAPDRTILREQSGRAEAIILIGASTGGVEALHQLLPQFPADCPPVVIVQHIRGSFSASFADRLDRICAARVTEARSGTALAQGAILVAPGDTAHLVIGGRHPLHAQLVEGPAVTGHRPSVDALFQSALPVAERVVACLLTGMGADGARGLLALRQAGAHTIAQDRATSTVYGMPRVAAELGAATRILPLSQIAQAILAAAAIRSGQRAISR